MPNGSGGEEENRGVESYSICFAANVYFFIANLQLYTVLFQARSIVPVMALEDSLRLQLFIETLL